MIRKMLVNATHPEENRVAIIEDGILSELDIEIAGQEQTKGNIYKATVVRVESGLQAAFVDYGAERLGFLQLGEIHPALYAGQEEDDRPRPRINDILRRGQELLVQIVKEERGNKGAALTTYLSLPGRYMVLMPGDKARGISRKIPDGEERKALRKAVEALQVPEDMGIIVRTAAIGRSAEELQRDLDYLVRLYRNIRSHADGSQAPALVYQESNLVIRSIRDYFMPDMDEVLIDDPQVYQQAREFFSQVMPEFVHLVKLHQEQRPIFAKYQIEEQIETITQNQVNLPSGGSIVIDPTEALVAIDVNSGKMAGEQGIEATAYKTNLEAATEVARQLRLRDLGGLIVIDFIDMRDRKHVREVEKTLKAALASDKARVTVGRISQFGLLEMSRQRIKAALAAGAWNTCPHCNGRGKVKSTEAQAVAVMRKIHAAIAKKQIARVEVRAPLEVADYLHNSRREELLDMERRYQTSIVIHSTVDLKAEEVILDLQKREKQSGEKREGAEPVTAATALAKSLAPERKHTPETGDEAKPHQQSPSRRTDNGAPADEDTASGERQQEKRRSRRRRRKSADKAATGDLPADTEAAGKDETQQKVTETAAAVEQPADSGGEQASENKPRRRRTARKKSGETQQEKTTDAAAATEQAADSGEQAPEEKPKRRRTARKKSNETQQEATTDAATATEQAADSGEQAPEEKPKRRRTARKKSGETQQEATTDTATATEQAADSGEQAPEEKPKRRRTARKKSNETQQEATTETATATGQSADSDDEKASEDKPKRRRSTRRKTTDTPETTS
ncbi:RNAse E [Geothermobacter ehrlichii]|uniref:Ribonuclease G n=1 Tax=Geothermobacter ehrlichii TaxID=213224 RepID=A0A5D3WMN3_9BACT|nr:Rne/Rng family ribonuclease [Geothermobacter ehrlichii]TYO99857.1 RNAse E [Geothermobacter ehrlichii]